MGRARLAELAAHGVICAVRVTSDAPTGSVVVLAERTERTMLADRGANLLLSTVDIDGALDASGAVHLHLSGYPLLDAASRPAARHALRAAAARGATTSVDAASAGPLRRAGGPAFLSWVPGIDVLFANLDEARALVDREDRAEARALVDRDDPAEELARALASVARIAVVKTGRHGAVSSSPDGTFAVPAVPARVVDATGAGDAFAAGYLAAWLDGAPPEEALAAGTRWGAKVVALVGARPPLPLES